MKNRIERVGAYLFCLAVVLAWTLPFLVANDPNLLAALAWWFE